MSAPSQSSVLDVAGRLRVALDALAAALAAADPRAVLDVEPQLASALAVSLPLAPLTDPADRTAVRLELLRASHALHQCRGTGVAIAELLHATLAALGREAQYDRLGARPGGGVIRGRGVKARG